MALINPFLTLAVLAITLALHAHLLERQRTMALTHEELTAALNNATDALVETQAEVNKIGAEQAGLIAKVDDLTAALAAGTTLSPEAEAAAAALTAQVSSLRGAVKAVDDQVQDAAPV